MHGGLRVTHGSRTSRNGFVTFEDVSHARHVFGLACSLRAADPQGHKGKPVQPVQISAQMEAERLGLQQADPVQRALVADCSRFTWSHSRVMQWRFVSGTKSCHHSTATHPSVRARLSVSVFPSVTLFDCAIHTWAHLPSMGCTWTRTTSQVDMH